MQIKDYERDLQNGLISDEVFNDIQQYQGIPAYSNEDKLIAYKEIEKFFTKNNITFDDLGSPYGDVIKSLHTNKIYLFSFSDRICLYKKGFKLFEYVF
jgi:hypothetical protein